MHALRAAARCQFLAFRRPSGLRSLAHASAASPPVQPPGAPLKKQPAPSPPSSSRRRLVVAPPSSSPPSPTSLLLALQRSERFSRDAELLGALDGMEDEEHERESDSHPGPLLTLGARLWLEGLREETGARRRQVAEALARLAGFAGPGLFGSVCRGGEVPRRTVVAALDVLEVLAEYEDAGGSDDDEDGPASASARRPRFTRALREACAREVEDLMIAEDDDKDDIDASE